MGKGCKRRPLEIDSEEFEDNWDTIFKRDTKNNEVMKHHRKKKWQKEEKNDS